MKKSFIILLFVLLTFFFIGLFSYKIFSINLQKEKEEEIIKLQLAKEREIIQEQMKKEEEILRIRSDQAQKEKEDELRAKQIMTEMARANKMQKLDSCLLQTRNNYEISWANACKEKSELAKKIYKRDCTSWEITSDWNEIMGRLASNCWLHEQDMNYDSDCSLTAKYANELNASYRDSKDDCYKRYTNF